MKFYLDSRMACGLSKIIPAILASISLSACATLPSSGPTGREVQRSIAMSQSDIQLVELQDIASLPAPPARVPLSLVNLAPPPTDLIGPGDVIDITVYESGITLFGNSATKLSPDGGSFDTAARGERLLGNRVDDAGDIQVPYAGRLHVARFTWIHRVLSSLSAWRAPTSG